MGREERIGGRQLRLAGEAINAFLDEHIETRHHLGGMLMALADRAVEQGLSLPELQQAMSLAMLAAGLKKTQERQETEIKGKGLGEPREVIPGMIVFIPSDEEPN